jgi:hypothetical protein
VAGARSRVMGTITVALAFLVGSALEVATTG